MKLTMTNDELAKAISTASDRIRGCIGGPERDAWQLQLNELLKIQRTRAALTATATEEPKKEKE